MKNVFFIIKVCILLLPILSGCWDQREVNDLAVAVAIGIDKNEDDGYTLSVQVLNPSETASSSSGGGGGYDTPVTTYTATGDILLEALRKLTQKTPRKIYVGHIRLVVIGEELAKEGIYNTLDFLSRDPEMRSNFYIIVSKDCTAEEILKVLTTIEKIPANKLFESLESSSESWAATSKVKLNDLLDDIVSNGTQPTLTAVSIIGDPKESTNLDNIQRTDPKAFLILDGMAPFRENKLVGWLNEEESKGLNYLKGKVQNTIIVIDIDEGPVGVELIKTSTEIIPQFNKSTSPTMMVKISGEANIAEVNSNLDFMNKNVIAEVEKKTNEKIKTIIYKTVEKAQKEYESDIFGFGEILHKKETKKWNEIKHHWEEIYPNIPVEVNVEIKIRRSGTITNSFHNELLEE